MDRQIITIVISLFALLLTSCYDSFQAATTSQLIVAKSPTTTIEELHKLYTAGTRTINEELIVEGTVTANDEHGNLFKSFIIEKNGYAIEILDGLYDSFVRFPLGGSITLSLNGLALSRYQGALRAGLPTSSTSSYEIDYIGSQSLVDEFVTLTDYGQYLAAQSITIAEAEESMAGSLVRISNLRLHTDESVERTWSGYSLFRTRQLDTIWCNTSSYADFAKNIIPQCELSLTGILKFGNTDNLSNQFMLVLRGEGDCVY